MPGDASPGAVVAIWNGIADEMREEFYRWHETEHMPERVAIPGFLRGRRYRAVVGAPEFFTRYDLAGPEILTGEAYLARLNAPTEWTRRVVPHFRDTTRALCRVAGSTGLGARAWLVTVRIFAGEGEAAAATARRLADLAREIGEQGEATVHLLQTDDAASRTETAERKSRPPDQAVPLWVILAETRDLVAATTIERRLRQSLSSLGEPGAPAPVGGVYALEYDLAGG